MRKLDLLIQLPPASAMERLRVAAAREGITVIVVGDGDVQVRLPERDPEEPVVTSRGTFRPEGDGTRLLLNEAAPSSGVRIIGLAAAGFVAIVGFAAVRSEGANLFVAAFAAAALGGLFGGLVWLMNNMTAHESTDRVRRFVRETFADVSSPP
jgi:hypothetical protein